MRKIAVVAALAVAVVFGFMAVSSAHTPSGGASCDQGVWAQGSSYEAGDTNTLTVSVDGVSHSETFGTDGYLAAPIPDDGEGHTWAWSVETTNPDPAFTASDSGVITCGDIPPTETPTPTTTPTPSDTPTPTEPPTPTDTPTPTEPPTGTEPPVRTITDCVGNTVVVKDQVWQDGAWVDTGTSYTTKVCDVPGEPPVVEEGM